MSLHTEQVVGNMTPYNENALLQIYLEPCPHCDGRIQLLPPSFFPVRWRCLGCSCGWNDFWGWTQPGLKCPREGITAPIQLAF